MNKPTYRFDIMQNTPEWHAGRRGRLTASTAADMMMEEKTKTYNDLINTKVYERLSGEDAESFQSDWMRRGHELQSFARDRYELSTFQKVIPVGLVELDPEWVVCSPDGLIGEEGLLEIKCPKHTTHIEYLLSGKVPSDYMWQIQFQLMVTDREWCDFYSFHPNVKSFTVRVSRNAEMLYKLAARVEASVELIKRRLSQIGT